MSKRRWIAGGIGLVLAWHWLRGTNEAAPPPTPPTLQLAVLTDGFALVEATRDRHLIELDTNGMRRKRWAIPVLGDLRVVGTAIGSAVAWVDTREKVLRLAVVKKDGELGPSASFGRNAAQLCDGAASNSASYAVAWTATDGQIWFLRGFLEPHAANAPEKVAMTSAGPEPMRCAVRSAGESIAMFWRAGRGMEFDFCAPSGCQGLRAKVPVKAGEIVADLACVSGGCAGVFVTGQSARVVGFDTRGKVRWQAEPPANAARGLHITATGERAYAISFEAAQRIEVRRVLANNGSMELVWHGPASLTPPVLTWARDYLALAWWDGDALGTEVRYLAR